MNPSSIRLDLDRAIYNQEYFATHKIHREGDVANGSLVSEETQQKQDKPWWLGNTWRTVQYLIGDSSSPDAINGVFIREFEKLLAEAYQNDNPADIQNLKERLTNLAGSGKGYEGHKQAIFATPQFHLWSLKPYIELAEKRKKELEQPNLEAARALHRQTMDHHLQVVSLVMSHLLKQLNAVEAEGLFRISGEKSKVDAIAEAFKNQSIKEIQKRLETEKNPHILAKGLAAFIRNLEPPLIDDSHYNIFIAVDSAEKNQKMPVLKAAIRMLPPKNREILKMLCTHLRLFAEKESFTKMGISNLALVWSPNLLQTIQREKESEEAYKSRLLPESLAGNKVTEMMISYDVF